MTLQRMFIGMCMWDPSIIYKTKVTEKDFTDAQDAQVFKAMQEALKEGYIPDEGVIHSRTKIKLSTLFDYKDVNLASMTPNWMFYEKQLRESTTGKYLRTEIEKIINTKGLSSGDIVASFQELTNNVQSSSDFEISDMQKTITATVNKMIERSKTEKRTIGVESGLGRLDDLTQGFQPRKLYYIGARPSQGKTALILNFVANCNVPCGVISSESGKEEIATRLLSKDSLIDSQRLVVGIFKEGEMDRLSQSAARYYEKPIYIYDEPNPSIDTVVSIARQMKKRYDIQILYLDYLQCLSPAEGMTKLQYHEQVAYASKQMKTLARVLNIPVVVTAQLNREAEGIRPQLKNLSDSTQIERDADVIGMIYNTYDKENELSETWLLVVKNRDGKTGDVKLTFNRKYMDFKDGSY